MSPAERRKRIDSLFCKALEHEPSERYAFLGEACPDDAEVRAALEKLLEADAQAEAEGGRFLNPAAFDAAEMLTWMARQPAAAIDGDHVALAIRVYEHQRLVHADVFEGPVELGRQRVGEGGPFAKQLQRDAWRLVIAGLEECSVSRRHARLEILSDGKVQVTNLTAISTIAFQDGRNLTPGSVNVVSAPVLLTIGTKVLRAQGQ